MQQRRHRLDVVLAVDDVGRRRERAEVVRDGHGRGAKARAKLADIARVDDGRVAASEQFERKLAHEQLRARPTRHHVVGDEDAKALQQFCLSTFSASASASGARCSR
jgi:ketosteroid isomerase-like protein